MTLKIWPGVFHPGLFFSSAMMLEFLERQQLEGCQVLDLGTGSGILAMTAVRKGAIVTAVDISKKALENAKTNASNNKLSINFMLSDVFENIPVQSFDWIFVNPPYYPRDPQSDDDCAWLCGSQHDYFLKFFKQLPVYCSSGTTVIMVLSEVCNLDAIFKIAAGEKFLFDKLEEKNIWADGKNYIFQIKPLS